MQVSVEKVSNVERRLTIVVPANQVEEAYAKQIDRFAKQANIKGFRPGKAPASVIQQRFSDDARKEALSEVIQQALYEAIANEKLQPVSTPRIEPKALLANQPLEFIASFEVLPEIAAVKFSLDSVEKLNVEVKNDDIDQVLNQLQKQYAQWKPVERPAQLKDRLVLDYYAIFDGESDEANKAQNQTIELGANAMLPGFEDGLLGASAGEEKKLQLTLPENFPIAERAGKPIEFVVNVKKIYEAEIPTLDAEFAKKLGVKSGDIADLKEQIKQSLEMERNRLVKEKLKEQVFKQLLEQNPLEVPKALVDREAKNIHDEIYAQDQHHQHNHSDDEMVAFSEVAKKRVSLGLLIAEFAKQTNLTIDKERVEKRIEEIASVYENPQEVISWLSNNERRSGIEAQVMEDQVMDKLLDGVPVSEKTISYMELKGVQI